MLVVAGTGLQWVHIKVRVLLLTTPPIKFQNVKEIYRVVVLKSLWNFTHLIIYRSSCCRVIADIAPESIGTSTLGIVIPVCIRRVRDRKSVV